MLAGLLVFFGHFFDEISVSASKHAFKDRVLSYTLYGFISHLVSTIFFVGMIFVVGDKFVYNTNAIPFYLVRLVTEIIQCEIVYRALVKSDRTTFGFARILTIPLLLIVDIVLGYTISNGQLIGIGVIAAALLAYFGVEHSNKKGARLALISSVLSVANISLFKYDVSHFNSIGVAQSIMAGTMAIIYGVRVVLSKKDRVLLKEMKHHPMLISTFVSQSIANSIISYAYKFAPASLILALSRASAVVWSLLSGVFYFHEKKVLRKVFVCALLAVGLVIMVN